MRFRDYKDNREQQITVVESSIYPDALEPAILKYSPIIERFRNLIAAAKNSNDLFLKINEEPAAIRVQLQRVFRKYVSPDTSVEMLKRKTDAQNIVKHFGGAFRPLDEVRKALSSRPVPDEALIAVLAEYETRGQKGYKLTEIFFEWFNASFAHKFTLEGPVTAGPDVPLKKLFPDYPTNNTVDLVIKDESGEVKVIGYARYDSDRGGSQGLDRIASYGDKATEITTYFESKGKKVKVLFLNDGPGLLLGLLWDRYSDLEDKYGSDIIVSTLKMLDARVTEEWIRG